MDSATAAFFERYRSLALDGEPCSAPEVEKLERHFGVTLPAAYRAYLLTAGKRSPAAWVGTDCTINWLYQLPDAAGELLREWGQPPLPSGAFVFLMHQGYQFMYFVADGSSDEPPVYYFHEGESEVVRKFERVSELVACAAGQ